MSRHPDLEPRERAAYEAAARSMNMLIDLFRKQLPPLPEFNAQDPSLRMSILTHALIDAAAIKLHWLFAYAWSTSRQICLTAARNLVSYKLNLQEVGHFNPIMGVRGVSLFPVSLLTFCSSELVDDGLSRLHRRDIQSST